MNKRSRKLFTAMLTGMAQIYGAETQWNGRDKFSINPIAPEQEQKLEKRIQEKSALLSRINVVPVRDLKGEKLGLSAGNSIASRTNTEEKDRETQYIGNLDGDYFELFKTDFDTHIRYQTVDTWSSQPNFEILYRNKVIEQAARDRAMIAWNGTSVAVNTDRVANPLLQDVNKGFLQHTREKKPENLIGSDGTTTVKVGKDGDYQTLDEAVFDARGSLLDPWHKNDPDLVLTIGHELWHKHNLSLIKDNTVATERNALEAWFAKERIGGLRVALDPFLPGRAAVITAYDNLSIYWQEGSRRRTIIDNAKRDRIEDYNSVNEGYVVEDYGRFCGYDSSAILLPDGQGGWA